MSSDIRLVLDTMAPMVPEGAGIPIIRFPGNPYTVGRNAWAAKAWTPDMQRYPMPGANLFVGISAFALHDGPGKFLRRTKDAFRAGIAIMVDDLGDGIGSKLPLSAVKLDPTWLIESSPDNFQAWYVLAEPCLDPELMASTIKAMISQGLAAPTDPGMSGVSRVGRLPDGINGKPGREGFVTRILDIDEGARYTLNEIIKAYGIKPVTPRKLRLVPTMQGVPSASASAELCVDVLTAFDMVLSPPNADGWMQITCPWVHEHTSSVDSGSAYNMPSGNNNYTGAFHCHHGHCQGRNVADLLTWAENKLLAWRFKYERTIG